MPETTTKIEWIRISGLIVPAILTFILGFMTWSSNNKVDQQTTAINDQTMVVDQQKQQIAQLEKENEKIKKELRGAIDEGDLVVRGYDALPVGTILTSILPFEAFCKQVGQSKWSTSFNASNQKECFWSPADGRTAAGSKYAEMGKGYERVPDLRGVFLRSVNEFDLSDFARPILPDDQKDKGPRNDNGFQGDAVQEHKHLVGVGTSDKRADGQYHKDRFIDFGSDSKRNAPIHSTHGVSGASLSSETRPKNIAVYRYIKIN